VPTVLYSIDVNYYFQTCQIHLKRGIQNLFSDLLIQPNGIQTILRVACDLSVVGTKNFCEFGAEEWSNLIHSYYMKSKVQYIRNIIPQVNKFFDVCI